MRRALGSLACAAGIALLGITGCGDDDSTALSREQFIAQADRICAAGNSRIEAAVPKGGGDGPPSGAEGRAFYDVIIQETEKTIAGVQALDAPDELQADVDAMLAAARSSVAAVRATPVDEFFASSEDPFEDVGTKAREIGLDDCAG